MNRKINPKNIEKQEQSLTDLLKSIADDPSLPESKKLDTIIHLTALTCALVAVQPIPFADLFILSPIQVAMVVAMSYVMGNPIGKSGAGEIVASIAGVVGWGVLAQQVVLGLYKTVLPFMGGFTTLPLVYTATIGLGYAAKAILEARKKDQTISEAEIKRIQEEAKIRNKTDKITFDNVVNELREWRKKAHQYQQYSEELRKQEKDYKKLEKENLILQEEYQKLQKNTTKISELEKDIRDSQKTIENIIKEKNRLNDLLKEEQVAKYELEQKINQSSNIKTKQELELEAKRIKTEKDLEYILEEASKLENQLLEERTNQKLLTQELVNKEEQIKVKEQKLNNLIEQRFETLKKRLRICYTNLKISDSVIKQVASLDNQKINSLERIFGLLQYDTSKVNFKRTVQGISSNILEIEYGHEGRLYVNSEGNLITIVRVGDKKSQSKDIKWLKTYFKGQ